MIYLIIYNITSDALRQKVAKRLLAEGYERIQMSAFLGRDNPKVSAKLWTAISKWLAVETTARFYVIPLTESNLRDMVIVGEVHWDIDILLGTRNSLFI